MVIYKFALKRGTVLNGKYLIDKAVNSTEMYIEYSAVDLIIREEVIIREFYPTEICFRNIEVSDAVSISNEMIFSEKRKLFQTMSENISSNSSKVFRGKNFFYENETAYFVLVPIAKKVAADEGQNPTSKMVVLVSIIVGLLLVGVVLGGSIFLKNKSSNKKHMETAKAKTEEAENAEDEDGTATEDEEGAEAPVAEEEPVDPDVVEAELNEKLRSSVTGEIIESFFGDFNDDGKYEMWAVVWDDDGMPYNVVFASNNRESNMCDACESNQYNLETDKKYRQLQIWYADENSARLIDDMVSFILAKEYVNGSSSGWGEDTFYYPNNLDVRMILYGKNQQLVINYVQTWMTGRGWGIDEDTTVAMYGNEGGPAAVYKEENSSRDYAFHGDVVCLIEYSEYYPECESNYSFYYPIYYLDGSFNELASTEISMADVEKLQGYSKVRDAASKQLIFSAETFGAASTVIYTFTADSVDFSQCLYNDSGFIYLNGTASGILEKYVTAFVDEQEDPKCATMDVCLELTLDNGAITSCRWLGAHQKKSATNYSKINSDFSNVNN